jgi:hypothetical protein
MNKQHSIGNFATAFLIVMAVCIDVLQALIDVLSVIPIVGFVLAFMLSVFVDICAWFFFAIAFTHINVPIMKKHPLGFIGTLIFENIPICNALPGWTLFVTTTVIHERAKEALSPNNEQSEESLAFGEV